MFFFFFLAFDRYDVLFMPPSFPFGGMENPCITFVTPCLLAGDRSLADVIIHEISHSWFGNLVTNAHWGEFWLNEGFTMYAQRRISAALYGEWPIINAQGGRYSLAFSVLATFRYVWLAEYPHSVFSIK